MASRNLATLGCFVRNSFYTIPFQYRSFAKKVKSKGGRKQDDVNENEVEIFDLEPYLLKVTNVTAKAKEALQAIKPATLDLEQLRKLQVVVKGHPVPLADVAQVIFKSANLVHVHAYDTRHKTNIHHSLSSDPKFHVQDGDGDLTLVRLVKADSSHVAKIVAAKVNAIQQEQASSLMQIKDKAMAKIKQVNFGDDWHRKQQQQLDLAISSAKADIGKLVKKTMI